MKEISLAEQQKILLGIAAAFDTICTDHNIPYYMLGGTMLGAVRHKGFIPWDDDMDFGVPRNNYERLLGILEDELPARYRCRTFRNSINVIYPYVKIEDAQTKCMSRQYTGDIEDYLGINIDIFPLDYCQPSDNNMRRAIWLADKYGRLFTPSVTGSWLKMLTKRVLRGIIPVSKRTIYNKIENLVSKIERGDYLANVFGHWEEKEVVPLHWYGVGTRYDFEGLRLCGLKDFDNYLKQLYGDYMQLPPIEKRTCHADKCFLLE